MSLSRTLSQDWAVIVFFYTEGRSEDETILCLFLDLVYCIHFKCVDKEL